MGRSLAILALLAGAADAQPAPAPPPNPYNPSTWIAKLGDPRETERAVTELEQLGDPIAIEPLGKAWAAGGRPVRMLQVIVSLARPLTAAEATAKYFTNYDKTGRAASWDKALPILVRAVGEIDETSPRSVDSAQKAADALGEARLDGGIAALAGLAHKPPNKKLIAAQLASIRALGHFAGKANAAAALVAVVDAKPPAKAAESDRALYFGVTGASINALAELRTTAGIPALLRAMYRSPELFMQVRRALVSSGPSVGSELRKILAGKHADINALFKASRLDQSCDKAGTCQPVSARDFYAAIVLGDLQDPAAGADLIAALGRPALPTYFIDGQPSPNTQYNAIFDSLRKLGTPEAAEPVHKLWLKGTELTTRVLALGAYPFVARANPDVDELAKLAADNAADDALRQEAATALARLAHDVKAIEVFETLAQQYVAAAAKAEPRAAKAYRAYARMFQTHIARVEIAIRCKDDLVCFGESLRLTPAAEAKNLAMYIKDLDQWTAEDKLGLVAAAIERSMIELGKRGAAAAGQTQQLLDHVGSEDRLIRQSILLALPKLAKLPCAACQEKLQAAIDAAAGKTGLEDLTLETTLLRNYFSWAGGRAKP